MKRCWKLPLFSSSMILLLIVSTVPAEGQWSEPELVNGLVTHVDPPVFEPGNPATLSFLLTNPFHYTIFDIEVILQPYLLVYEDGKTDWSGLVDPPTLFNATAGSSTIRITSLTPHGNITLGWSIITTPSTTRGSMFAQSVYLVKLALSFDVAGQRIFYASRGYFTEDQWNTLTETADQDPTGFNMTYLKDLGYSGIIPDISFIVRDEIPIWPAFAVVGVACFTGTIALYHHLKGDPMAAPRLYRILVRARKGLRRFFSFMRRG